MKYVALLRGVNVGGKNILPMKSLAAIFCEAGCNNVETYIQSGNVVFSAGSKLVSKLETGICSQIQRQFGFGTFLILRSYEELQKTAGGNPYADIDHSHVMFLASAPKADQAAALDPNRSPGDEFTVVGKDVYLYLPNGTARSKLTNAYFDSKLKTVSTLRNWKTLLKLLAMMAG